MPLQPQYRDDPAAAAVLSRRVDDIVLLTLNRPARRNALSEEILAGLSDALTAIAHDTTIRAVVLTAVGSAFCAGHDLKQLTAHRADSDGGRAYFATIMTACSATMQQIVALPQPVIAAVQGVATAAGCQLVASCDLAIASAEAKFATPGVDIGLFCSTPMVALSRNVARKHAMEMLLTGEMIDAEHAARIGLINRVADPGSECDEALTLARKIASKPSYTVKVGKEAFYRQAEMGLAAAYRYASEVMVENMMARDAQEGICAFIDKRTPQWSDR
jgi:enoyl-CoA hydratase/carnithine racemase